MADYRKMYIKLFQSVTKAIQLLQEAQQETEDVYIESGDATFFMLTKSKDEATTEESDKTNQGQVPLVPQIPPNAPFR